jgi:UDP:flavonoid glycosyltransferase YjiC (YdhE family)
MIGGAISAVNARHGASAMIALPDPEASIRVLFSCTAGEGHFRPLLPLARAFAAAGDDVAFAAPAESAAIESSGFRHLPAGIGVEEVNARFAPKREKLAAMPPHERRPFVFTWRFAETDAPAKVDDLHAAATSWSPDLMVYESADLSAPIVAATLGVPAVHHAFGRMVPVEAFTRAAESIAPLWRARGLEPPPLCGAFAGAYVDICPPSFQTNRPPVGTHVEWLRPVTAVPPTPTDPPTVYVTLGTAFNELELFRVLLEAVAEVDCSVIATIGRNNDPGALGAVPPNVQVERYVPQEEILPRCAATIGHGGSGSTLAALAYGLPMLLVPQGADQFENAKACAELGVARVLMPGEMAVDAVHDALVDLLADPVYRERARTVAAEIADMPPAEVVASTLRSS